MTLVYWHHSDAYEVSFTMSGVTSIIRYRRGMNVRGEVVDYDLLPPDAQNGIYTQLKKALNDLRHDTDSDLRDDSSE